MRNKSSLSCVTDADGLVGFPDEVPSGFPRAAGICAAVLFAVVLVGTAIVDVVMPAPLPTLIGAEKRRDQGLRENARPWDGSLFRLWEHDLRLRSRIRRVVTDKYSWWMYRYFRHVQGELVVGPRGWLFLSTRTEVPKQSDTALARKAGAVMAAVERRLQTAGLQVVIIPVPRKSALYAYELPGRISSRPQVDRAVVRDFRRRGLRTVDLWSVFENEMKGHSYNMLGSHWTDEAQWFAARETARVCAVGTDVGDSKWSLRSSGPSFKVDTDLLGFAGIRGENVLPDAAARTVFNLVDEDGVRALPQSGGEPGRSVILGTSFTYNRKFPLFVAHFFGEDVWSGARAGTFPGDVVASFLESSHQLGRSELLLFEVPGHHLVKQPILTISNPVFSKPPRGPMLRYRTVLERHRHVSFKEEHRLNKEMALVTIPAGWLAHTGDGVVSLRVRGSASRDVSLRIDSPGSYGYTVPWGEETGEIVLPLLAPGSSSHAVQLTAVSGLNSAAFTIDAVDIVSETYPKPRVALELAQPMAISDGWEIILRPSSEHVLGPVALLEIGLAMKGEFSGRLSVEIRPTDGEGMVVDWSGLSPAALGVVSLGPMRGQTIESIRLTGPGAPPLRALHRVVVRPGI